MAVRSVQPLIQAAPCDSRIPGWSRIAALSRRSRRRRYDSAALNRRHGSAALRWRSSCASRRGRGRHGPLGLPVGDVILVARRTRPGRSTAGLAAGPMRPMIGNRAGKLGACPETEAEAQRCQRQKRPIEYHATCWISPSARGMG
jgi:hypothetical protein